MKTLGTGMKKLFSGYQTLIEYFIPNEMRKDRAKANQARMFLISHTMGPVLGNSVPLALYLFDPTPGFDVIILSLGITAFWLFPFLLRRGINYDGLVCSSVVNLNFVILWSCYFYGGVASPTMPWLMIIPILSLFYIGGERRLQPALLAISAGSFVLFLAAYLLIEPAPNDMPVVAMHGLGIISTIAALCYVATMAIYYSRIFDAGVELEQEIRRRMKTTNELREAVAAADRASSIKADFLAGMSHELRTPLNAVISYSEMMKEDLEEEGNADGQTQADIDRIQDAAHYLLRLINMILDLSKIEARHMNFYVTKQDVPAMLERVVDSQRELIAKKGNVIDVKVDPEAQSFCIDEGRVSQVLEEIIENAASYTENGLISVHARIVDGGTDAPRLRIGVKDTGVGIPANELPTVFESFYTFREAANGRYGGTGLSLHVVQKLCQAMGGEISVRSEVGVGSTFELDFPDRPENVDEKTKESREKLARLAA